MPAQPLQGVLHKLRRIVFERDRPASADGMLVRSFVAGRDEAAFALLVERHGPMVFGVCRRILGNVHDAEDAFQATFLVLARKAASVQPPDLVGNWLYGVASRAALDARSRVARRNVCEKQMAELPHPIVNSNADVNDLKQLIDHELNRLPDKYRAAVVLCELEGRSRKEVAELLHVPEGTLSSRLATARKMLADRLSARGLALAAALITTWFAQEAAHATVPPGLCAAACLAGYGATGVSTNATILAENVMKAMLISKIKTVALYTLTLCLATVCLAMLATYTLGGIGNSAQPPNQRETNNNQNTQTETNLQQKKEDDKKDSPKVEKLAAFTGIHVKQGTVVIRQSGREAIGATANATVENGTLILSGGNPTALFAVEVKELTSLKVDGVGKVTVVDLKGKKLEVIVTRPATVILAGFVDEQTIRVAAGGSVDAQSCKGKSATVNVSAGGRAIVHVSDKLDATVTAGGTLEHFGTPKLTQNVSPGGTLRSRDGNPVEPKIDIPAKDPVGQKDKEQPKEQPLLKGALVLTAEVDGYTQGTTFNLQKYPFKYTGVSALDADQLKSLSKAGDIPPATAKALLSCLLWPKEGDTLQKAALKCDGKKITGDVEVLHKYGKQGTHVLALKLEGTIDDGRLTLKAVSTTVTGAWDSGFPIKLKGDVKVTITAK